MDLKRFSRINRERCEAADGFNHRLEDWSLSDWFLATVGELGEAANVGKKLNRVRDGIPGNKETEPELREKLKREIADTFIYMDLLAQSQGFELSDVVPEVFNAKSAAIGCGVHFATHYVHYNGAACFVKEAEYFVASGGLVDDWGKLWRPVVADSIEDARQMAKAIFEVKTNGSKN